jgi:hypothetical protein
MSTLNAFAYVLDSLRFYQRPFHPHIFALCIAGRSGGRMAGAKWRAEKTELQAH